MTLAPELEGEELERYLSIQRGHSPHEVFQTGETKRFDRKHKRKIPIWKITWAQLLIELGLSQIRVQRALALSCSAVKDVSEKRVNQDGRPPIELEPFERYARKRRCVADC
jgi:hypothetical protein